MMYEELVNEIREIFTQADVSHVKEHIAYQFNIEGEAEGAFYAEISEGKVCVEPYEYYDRDVVFTLSADTLLQIANGQLDAIHAFNHHMLTVEGNFDKALILQKFSKDQKKEKAKEAKAEKKAAKAEKKTKDAPEEKPESEKAEPEAVKQEELVFEEVRPQAEAPVKEEKMAEVKAEPAEEVKAEPAAVKAATEVKEAPVSAVKAAVQKPEVAKEEPVKAATATKAQEEPEDEKPEQSQSRKAKKTVGRKAGR